MALTELQCRNAKETGKDYQLSDGEGLLLVVRAKGAKLWRCEYRIDGKKSKYSYGNYPDFSLAEARTLHAAARKLVALGRHPAEVLDNHQSRQLILKGHSLLEVDAAQTKSAEKQAQASRTTFAQAADKYKVEWVDKNWKAPDKGFASVRLHLLPKLGEMALEDIDASLLREHLYEVRERSGVQAALHAHGWASRVFGYALEHDLCTRNPAQAIKAARIGAKGYRERWLTTPEIRRYLAHLYQSECYRGYKLALHLLLMLALRKNELCGANWSEFDLDAGEWLIPAGRMKGKKDHIVFLPIQAVEMLRELQHLGYGSAWVMPMPTNSSRPMNDTNLDGAHAAAITAAKIDDYVIHDHQHTASTQLREMGNLPEVVETALSHAIPGMAGVYSHAQYKKQRLAMLQEWADFLDKTMNEQTVIAATFRKLA